MRKLSLSICFLIMSVLSLYATVVPVSQAKMVTYPLPTQFQTGFLQNDYPSAQLQVAADSFYYYLAVDNNKKNCVLLSLPTSNFFFWPDGDANYPMSELVNSQKRLYKMGDSVVLVILDSATSNTIIYTKKISDLSGKSGQMQAEWNRTQLSYRLVDSTRWNNKFADTMQIRSLAYFSPSGAWSILNGSLTTGDTTVSIPNITLFGLPEADYKANLWAYGLKGTDTVLVKYERISNQAFYYNPSFSLSDRILNRNLSQNLSYGVIFYYPNTYKCYIADKPYIVPTDTVIVSSTPTKINSTTYQCLVTKNIHVYDDLYTSFYYVPTLIANSTSDSGIARFAYARPTNNYLKLASQIVINAIDSTSYSMRDTLPFKIYLLNNAIAVDSVKDTTIEKANYSKSFNVKNAVSIKTISTLPSWLTLQLTNEIPFSTSTTTLNQGMNTYTLSGTPTDTSVFTIQIVFLDTVPNCINDSTTSFQACTLSFKITVDRLTNVIGKQQTLTDDFIKIDRDKINYGLRANGQVSIQAFDLMGRIVLKVQKFMDAGTHTFKINTAKEKMIYRIVVGSKQLTKLVAIY